VLGGTSVVLASTVVVAVVGVGAVVVGAVVVVASVVAVVVVVEAASSLLPQAAATNTTATKIAGMPTRRIGAAYRDVVAEADSKDDATHQGTRLDRGTLRRLSVGLETMQDDDHDFQWFTDAADARAYLDEIGRLWIAWLLALAALLAFDGLLLVVTAFAVVAAWLILAKPLQRRAARLVEDEPPEEEGWQAAASRGKHRDQVLRELTVGRVPLETSLLAIGASPWWAYARYGVITLTVVAFIYVIRGFAYGS
jgi:hypothetical protein